MRTIFYIDGFNLYYGLRLRIKHKTKPGWFIPTGKYKWLNLDLLCHNLRKKDDIRAIKYFSARITGSQDKVKRQKIYWKALGSTPLVEIIEGHYLESHPTMPLFSNPSKRVQVIKQEEKGTDVNIASHMLVDAFHDKCDVLVLITNDSDLCFPISYIQTTLKKDVLVYNPQTSRPSTSLQRCAKSINHINNNTLRASQFPQTVVLPDDSIVLRPSEWK